jgi:AAA domain
MSNNNTTTRPPTKQDVLDALARELETEPDLSVDDVIAIRRATLAEVQAPMSEGQRKAKVSGVLLSVLDELGDDGAQLLDEIAGSPPPGPSLVSADDFAAVDEEGADPLIGDADCALIAENSDIMATGNGGAGKTTLTLDMACHLAAGDPWLGNEVPRAVNVLIIENEGPRPLFRKKVRRKLDAWAGSPLEGRLRVLDEPWAAFSFSDETARDGLADVIAANAIDVLVAGPVTKLGMDEAGTLQQVRDFMKLVQDVRAKAARPLAILLVHHDNKAGTVSGAWEGAGDTLLHVEARGNGRTDLEIQKARWSPEHHGRTLKLKWIDGEGYAIEDDRDYLEDIVRFIGDGARTVKEIMVGVSAGEAKVKEHLGIGIDSGRIKSASRSEAQAKRDKISPSGKYYVAGSMNV